MGAFLHEKRPPLLEFSKVSFAYHTMEGETPVFCELSFSVEEGDFLAIVGPSGCGKSTILSLVAGLLESESGSIFFQNQKPEDAKVNIGYMLQRDHLFEWRTVLQNVTLGLEIRKQKTKENVEKAVRLLEKYGLGSFLDARPSQLSGGMRQRAALIRTLVLEPELLLLDEPFSALDYQTRLSVGDDIGTIIANEKKTAILVTHDLAEAISLGNQVLVLSSRPASIVYCQPLTFEEGLTPLEKRNTAEFQTYFQKVWKELNPNEGS